MKRVVLTICLLFLILSLIASNSATKTKEKTNDGASLIPAQQLKFNRGHIYPEWGFFIDGSTGISTIQNNNLSSDLWSYKSGLGYAFSVGYFRSISESFLIKSGLGISSYSSTSSGNGEVSMQQLKDIDNDNYTESLTLLNVENNVNLTYLSIPVILEFGNVNVSKLGFYIDFGVKYSFLVNDLYETKGSYTTKGTYDQWNVTLENVPELGFYTGKNVESNAKFKKSNFSLIGGVGISIPLSGEVILKMGVAGNYGLYDIGNNPPKKQEENPLSSNTYDFRSRYIDNSLAAAKGSKTRYLAIEFGLYINKLVK